MPSDNYNIERLTIARGPNAILFGLGQPAGIIDATLKRGNLRKDISQIQLRVTSDNSKRGTFDLNRVVLKDKLALRFDGMTDEGITRIKPNLDRQTRLFGAVTAKPFKSTSITITYEHVNWSSNRAKSVLPQESYTPWLHAASIPGSTYANQPLFDNRGSVSNLGNNPVFAGPGNANAIMSFGGGGTVGDFDMRGWTNSVTTRQPSEVPAAFSSLNSYDKIPVSPNIAGPVPYDTNLFGDARFLVMKSDTFHVFLEQQLARNLFLEAAWFHQRYRDQNATAGFGGSILMDANLYLNDGTPNPNVGRYYTQNDQSGGNDESKDKRDSYRATLSYELDLRRKAGWMGKWLLGKLRFAGLASQDNQASQSQQFKRTILENPAIPGLTPWPTGSIGTGTKGTGTQFWATSAKPSRNFITRFYLGGPEGNANPNPFGNLFDNWYFKDANGQTYGAYLSTTPYKSVEGWPLAAAANAPSGKKSRTNTTMLTVQDYLFADRLVLLYGYRKDKVQSATIDPKYQVQDWSGLYPNFHVSDFAPMGATQSGKTETYGVVAHITSWLSALYNRSNTFQPDTGNFDPFGQVNPGSAGLATDYGLNFSLLHDSLRLRIARYENTAGPKGAGNVYNDPIRDNLWAIENEMRFLDPSMPTINVGSGGFRDRGRNLYSLTKDSVAKGYELDVSWQPNRNWSFVVNGAAPKSVDTNIGNTWIEWINTRLPVWQSLNVPEGGKTQPNDVNKDGTIGTWTWTTAPYTGLNGAKTFAQYYDQAVKAQCLDYFAANNGLSVDQGRGYRANFMANYHFTEGRLKGLSTNLAFRYRAAPNIGYGVKTQPDGTLFLDVDKPILGLATVNTDMGIVYSGRVEAFKGLRYRVQLNVRNLFNEWTLVPVTALTTGQHIRYNRLPPRTYIATTTFDF